MNILIEIQQSATLRNIAIIYVASESKHWAVIKGKLKYHNMKQNTKCATSRALVPEYHGVGIFSAFFITHENIDKNQVK